MKTTQTRSHVITKNTKGGFMFKRALEVVGLRTVTVDKILSQYTKTLDDLERHKANMAKEYERAHEAISLAELRAAACSGEISRAGQVASSLKSLLSGA